MDMLVDKPLSLILRFTIISYIGLLVEELYITIDSIILGQLVGDMAFAAVGSSTSTYLIFQSFCFGFCGAIGAFLAKAIGEKNEKEVHKKAYNTFVVVILFGLILSLIFVILLPNILILIKTPNELYKDVYIYLKINSVRLLAIFVFDYSIFVSQSVGDSKLPAKFSILTSVMNLIFDVVFIGYLNLGVAGAAYGSVIAEVICGILFLKILWKKHPEIIPYKSLDFKLCLKIIFFAIPMGLQGSVTFIGGVILQMAVNTLGSVYVAAQVAGSNIQHILSRAFVSLGQAATSYCGQNYGAKNMKRVKDGIKCSIIIISIYSVISFIIIWFSYPIITKLFMPNVTLEILELTKQYVLFCGLFFIPLGLVNLLRNVIQSLGYTILASVAGVCELVARTVIALVFVSIYQWLAVILGLPICWIVTCLYLIPTTIICVRKREKEILNLK